MTEVVSDYVLYTKIMSGAMILFKIGFITVKRLESLPLLMNLQENA